MRIHSHHPAYGHPCDRNPLYVLLLFLMDGIYSSHGPVIRPLLMIWSKGVSQQRKAFSWTHFSQWPWWPSHHWALSSGAVSLPDSWFEYSTFVGRWTTLLGSTSGSLFGCLLKGQTGKPHENRGNRLDRASLKYNHEFQMKARSCAHQNAIANDDHARVKARSKRSIDNRYVS
jgi:hypothetical protein